MRYNYNCVDYDGCYIYSHGYVTKTKKDDAIVAKIGAVIAYLFGKRPQ